MFLYTDHTNMDFHQGDVSLDDVAKMDRPRPAQPEDGQPYYGGGGALAAGHILLVLPVPGRINHIIHALRVLFT